MGYLGNKSKLTDRIINAIQTNAKGAISVVDVFAGTGAVSKSMKQYGFDVTANDKLYSCYVQNKAALGMNEPLSPRMKEIIGFLNSDAVIIDPPCQAFSTFIRDNYSPYDGCNRMYFQTDNALRIDYVRQWIEYFRSELTEAEYFYLLSLLLDGVQKVANTSGTYGAPLHYWQRRSYHSLTLTETPIINSNSNSVVYNLDAIELARTVTADVAYLDPPYCDRQYGDYYHLPETIALYDCPAIHGKTGQRDDSILRKSDFCFKRKAPEAFHNLFSTLDVSAILLSYNNDKTSVLTTEQMTDVLCSCGKPDTFRLIEIEYPRYKSKNSDNTQTIKEQLYFIEK